MAEQNMGYLYSRILLSNKKQTIDTGNNMDESQSSDTEVKGARGKNMYILYDSIYATLYKMQVNLLGHTPITPE